MIYSIEYRRLENKTNLHINALEKINKNFCSIYPYFVNINLGLDVRCLLCDGEYVIDVTQWSGVGLSFSDVLTPSKDIKDLVHKFIFDVN